MEENEHYLTLKVHLGNEVCPYCQKNEVGIDNWGMFEGECDWFYYCKECDGTWSFSERE